MALLFQSRTERDLKRPGYCAFFRMQNFISLVASGRLRQGEVITPNRLSELGFPKTERYLVLAAARHLGFIDEQNRITDILEQIVHSTGEEYGAKLRKVLEETYIDFYSMGLDLAHATQQEFKQAFQACNYEPLDMQVKMIALFKGLARMAGILPDEGKESQIGNGQINTLPTSIQSPNTVPLVPIEDTSMQKSSQSNGLHPSQTDVARVRKLIASFARLDNLAENANSSGVSLDTWLEYVKMSYDFLGDVLTQIERDKQ